MTGWIKLHRSLSEWEWYSDHNTTRLLIHLLISVNYEDKKWRGNIIKSGSMVLSWKSLSVKSGLSIRQCRTAMDKLIDSGEVTKKVTNKFQLITLVKWDKLQSKDFNTDNQLVDKEADKRQTSGQSSDRPMTTTKEVKEIKEVKKIKNKDYNTENSKFSAEVHECYRESLNFFPESLHPVTGSSKNKWLDTIDKLNRIDNVPFERILRITKAAREDSFWKTAFMSIPKLRKKNDEDIKYIVVFNEKFKSKPTNQDRILQNAEKNIQGWG